MYLVFKKSTLGVTAKADRAMDEVLERIRSEARKKMVKERKQLDERMGGGQGEVPSYSAILRIMGLVDGRCGLSVFKLLMDSTLTIR